MVATVMLGTELGKFMKLWCWDVKRVYVGYFWGCCSLVGRMVVVTARKAAWVVKHVLRGLRAHVQSPKTQASVYLGPLPRVDYQLHVCSCAFILECQLVQFVCFG